MLVLLSSSASAWLLASYNATAYDNYYYNNDDTTNRTGMVWIINGTGGTANCTSYNITGVAFYMNKGSGSDATAREIYWGVYNTSAQTAASNPTSTQIGSNCTQSIAPNSFGAYGSPTLVNLSSSYCGSGIGPVLNNTFMSYQLGMNASASSVVMGEPENCLTESYTGGGHWSTNNGGSTWSDRTSCDSTFFIYGTCYGTSGGTTAAPTWVSPTPADASTVTTTFTVNASCTAGDNYYIWLDTGSGTTAVVTNSTTSYYTPTLTLPATYTYKAACWNATTGYSANTTARTAIYDPPNPSAPDVQFYTQAGALSSYIPNSSIINDLNLTVQMTCNGTTTTNTTNFYATSSATQYGAPIASISLVNYSSPYNKTTYSTDVLLDGNFSNFYIRCVNTTTKEYSNYTNVSFRIDRVAPTIMPNTVNNEFDSLNQTALNPYDNDAPLNITFTDDYHLYAYEINITRLDNSTEYFYYTNVTDSANLTSARYENTTDVTTWPSGAYNVHLAASDGHTAREIPDYQVTKKKSSITFKPGNDNNIKIETREASTIQTTKLSDRYTFTMTFDDGLTKARTFDVKTDKCPLTYNPKSRYKAHLVSWCGFKDGGNWIDFEGVSGTATVTRIDAYHYVVEIANVPPVAVFNSIGGLNLYETNYYFYRGAVTDSPTTAFANASFTNYLYVSDYGGITEDVYIVYDGTSYTPNSTLGVCGPPFCDWNNTYSLTLTKDTGSYAYTWVVNTTLETGSVVQHNYTGTHTVSNWLVYYNDTCPGSGDERINFTVYSEDTPGLVQNETAEMYLNFTMNGTGGLYQQTNLTYPSNTSFLVCMSPSNQTFYMDNYVKHTLSTGFVHRYYDQNATYPASTLANVSLYNFNYTTGISTLRVTVRDPATYSYKLNVLGILQRFYVGDGVWRSVQYDRSGDYGLLLFDIKEHTTDYRIAYYNATNGLYDLTDSVKFSCTSGVCDVTSLLEEATTTTSGSPVTATVSYDNTTHIITVNWTGSALVNSQINITVTHETMTGQAVACNALQNGSAGNYTCNVSLYNSAFYTTVYDVAEEEVVLNEIITKSWSGLSSFIGLADQAIWSFGLAATVVAAGLFSPAGTIISAVVALFIVSVLGILSPLSVTVLLVAGIISIVLALRLRT